MSGGFLLDRSGTSAPMTRNTRAIPPMSIVDVEMRDRRGRAASDTGAGLDAEAGFDAGAGFDTVAGFDAGAASDAGVGTAAAATGRASVAFPARDDPFLGFGGTPAGSVDVPSK